MSKVNRAIIPAAGRGTRMRPVSSVVPKELLPVGTVPIIQLAVEEAVAAGIDRLAVVINQRKELIRTCLEDRRERGDFGDAIFDFRYQEEATGLADAVQQCRDFTEGKAFALLLPDNVALSPCYRLATMIDLYHKHGQEIVGMIELSHRQSDLYGNVGRIEYESVPEDGVIRITRLI